VNGNVVGMDALAAVGNFPRIDAVFASWIPYEQPWDRELANLCADKNVPLVIIGEGGGGCTGSDDFWGYRAYSDEYDDEGDPIPEELLPKLPERRYDVTCADSLVTNFRDVPQWDGIHDHTYFTTRKK